MSQDLEVGSVLRTGRAMKLKSQVRAEWLMTCDDLTKWFQSDQSKALLVNGNYLRERVSPISFFCAMLIRSLKLLEPITAISHFCGPHLEPEDELSGGYGLLKNLTNQLVALWNFGELTCLDRDFVDSLRYECRHRNLSLGSLWELFQILVTALPPNTPLFIIIDGISFYETQERFHDTSKVISGIHRLVGDRRVEAMVKVLVTSPTRALGSTHHFYEDETVLIPANTSGARLGFSDRRFDMSFSEMINDLEFDSKKRTTEADNVSEGPLLALSYSG